MPVKLKTLNACDQNSTEQFATARLLLSSLQYDWNDITFFHIDALPGEVPLHSSCQHVITIPIRVSQGTTVEQLVNGKMKNVSLSSGKIIFDPVHVLRRFIHTRNSEGYSIHLSPSLISNIDRDQFNPDRIELLQASNQEDPMIFNIGVAIYKELASGHPFQTYIDSLKTCLAAHLLKNYASKNFSFKDYRDGLSKHKLTRVTEYINDNLSENISLQELAGLVGISQFYFSRLFKKSTGDSPCQYILQQRLRKAKNLLAMSDLSIADIALTCGFSHQSHLNRQFKKYTGTTPRIYRKSFI